MWLDSYIEFHFLSDAKLLILVEQAGRRIFARIREQKVTSKQTLDKWMWEVSPRRLHLHFPMLESGIFH